MNAKKNSTPWIIQQSTKDYSLFLPNPFNRARLVDGEFQPRKDLIASMKEHGFLKKCPIICTQKGSKLEIFDGHNRFATAKYLGIEVHYLVYPDDDRFSVIDENNLKKPWRGEDFIRSYADQGNEDYIELIEFSEKTGIPRFQAAALFNGDTSGNNVNDKIRNGTFKIKDRVVPYCVADVVLAIRSLKPKVLKNNLVVALAKCAVVPDFDMRELRERIVKHSFLLEEKRSADDYIMMLEGIYNRGRKGQTYPLSAKVKDAMRQRNVIRSAY
jgi:hypothetical protein